MNERREVLRTEKSWIYNKNGRYYGYNIRANGEIAPIANDKVLTNVKRKMGIK